MIEPTRPQGLRHRRGMRTATAQSPATSAIRTPLTDNRPPAWRSTCGRPSRIGAPVVVSRAGFVGLVVVDTVMSGRARRGRTGVFQYRQRAAAIPDDGRHRVAPRRPGPHRTSPRRGRGPTRSACCGGSSRCTALSAFRAAGPRSPYSASPCCWCWASRPNWRTGAGAVSWRSSACLAAVLSWSGSVPGELCWRGWAGLIPAMVITTAGVVANIRRELDFSYSAIGVRRQWARRARSWLPPSYPRRDDGRSSSLYVFMPS